MANKWGNLTQKMGCGHVPPQENQSVISSISQSSFHKVRVQCQKIHVVGTFPIPEISLPYGEWNIGSFPKSQDEKETNRGKQAKGESMCVCAWEFYENQWHISFPNEPLLWFCELSCSIFFFIMNYPGPIVTREWTIPELCRKKKLINFFLVPDFSPQFGREDCRPLVTCWLKWFYK